VVVQGPRFSTRAESAWYRAQGWDIVNMTQYPEAYLARELGMHYAGIALVTDYDTGVEHDPAVAAVTQDHVFEFFEANLHRMRALLLDLIPQLPDDPSGCECAGAIGPLSPYEIG
jgi:5'-methylthioadenosine phosphorylase